MPDRRLRGLGVVFSVAVALPPALLGQAAPRPNVLVIVTDDQGWGDIGYHNPRTLDDLARLMDLVNTVNAESPAPST